MKKTNSKLQDIHAYEIHGKTVVITGTPSEGYLWKVRNADGSIFIESEPGAECDTFSGAMDDAEQQLELFIDVLGD